MILGKGLKCVPGNRGIGPMSSRGALKIGATTLLLANVVCTDVRHNICDYCREVFTSAFNRVICSLQESENLDSNTINV